MRKLLFISLVLIGCTDIYEQQGACSKCNTYINDANGDGVLYFETYQQELKGSCIASQGEFKEDVESVASDTCLKYIGFTYRVYCYYE